MSQFERFYSKLFSVGTLKRNIVIYIFLVLTIAVIFNTIIFNSNLFSSLLFSVFLILIVICESILLKVISPTNNFFTIRRLLAVNYFSYLFAFPTCILIYFIFPLSIVVIQIFFGIIILLKSLTFYVILFSEKTKTLSPIIINILWGYLASIALSFMNIYYIIILPIFALLSVLYVWLIEVTTENAISYFKGYIESWLLDNPGYLESFLLDISHKADIEVRQLTFKNSYSFNLVFPSFHFGPFRNVGSSEFPSLLKKIYYTYIGELCAVFHTPVTHEYDLSTINGVYKVIRSLIKSYPHIKGLTKISDIFDIKDGDVKVYGFTIGPLAIIFLSCEEMEDIPLAIAKEIRDIGVSIGFRDVIVVDSHIGLSGNIRYIDKEKLNKMIMLSKKLLYKLLEAEQYQIKAVFKSIMCPQYSIDDGLGSGGISVFAWEGKNHINLIILFDTNNLNPKYRDTLIKKFKEKFKSANVIVASSDTHEVTARTLRYKRGYSIWGEKPEDYELIDRLIPIIKLMISNMQKFVVNYHLINVNVNILGRNILEKAERMIREGFRKTKLFACIFYLPITTILILSLILLGIIF